MIPLASLDAALILAETAEMPLHNLGVLILEPLSREKPFDYESMRRTFEARLHLAPEFRRRLLESPLGLADLRWIEDPRFDLGRHLLRATLPPPGGQEELAAFIADYAARLLDRDKPLWELVVVDGLASGDLAAIAKIHHAAMDGLHLSAMIGDLFNAGPDEAPHRAGIDTWRPERELGRVRLAIDSARLLVGKPRKVARAAASVVAALIRSRHLRASRSERDSREARIEIPPTPWRGALTVHRTAAFTDVSLEDIRAICAAFGTTVNDVVLAAAAGSLRRWLLAHDALPNVPLIANVPIAVKRAGEQAANQISMLRLHLPTDEADAVARLQRIHAEAMRGKKEHHASGANPYRRLTDLALGATVPAFVAWIVRFYSSHRGGDFHPALWNVVISNVPGPPHELYLGGAHVKCIYPFGPVQHGSGLNLTVISTGDRLGLGVLACREKVPDVADIATAFTEEIESLLRRPEVSSPLHSP